jgi:hypothetical protein
VFDVGNAPAYARLEPGAGSLFPSRSIMRVLVPALLALLGIPGALCAQTGAPAGPDSIAIAAAVAPLPEEFRATATVLGYREGSRDLIVLREGEGPFLCLADNPTDSRFHVACYHRSLEPFMSRGRTLRAEGHAEHVDSIREAEIRAGTLPMPTQPAALYSLTAPAENFDPQTGTITGAQPLHVVYIPFATVESTGLSGVPVRNAPWLMFPGTARAHIMFVPEMLR